MTPPAWRPSGLHKRRPCPDVEKAFIAAHMAHVSISKFFAILIAMAMLFAPFVMQGGSAMAAAPASHHGQITMAQGSCDGQTDNGQGGNGETKDTGMPCCVAMCAAIAVSPVAPVEPVAYARVAETQAIEQFGPGFLIELATPPPRRA